MIVQFPFTNDPLSQVELIYIAYFGRAGDPVGTNYWVNELTASGDTVVPGLTGVAAAFSQQAEAMAEYPFLANPEGASQADIQSFINAVYQNLFGHSADPNGLMYWTNEVNAIIATGDPLTIANGIGQMAISIALGAQTADAAVLSAKVVASDFLTDTFAANNIDFGNDGSAADQFAHTDIAGVNGPNDVPAADAATTNFVAKSGPNPSVVQIALFVKYKDPTTGLVTIKKEYHSGFITDDHTITTSADSLYPKATGGQIQGAQITDSQGNVIQTGTMVFHANPNWKPNTQFFISPQQYNNGTITISESLSNYPKIPLANYTFTGTKATEVGYSSPGPGMQVSQQVTTEPIEGAPLILGETQGSIAGSVAEGGPVLDNGVAVGIQVPSTNIVGLTGAAAILNAQTVPLLSLLAAFDDVLPGQVVCQMNSAPTTAIDPDGNGTATVNLDPVNAGITTLVGFGTINLASLGTGVNGIDGFSATNTAGGVTIIITGTAPLNLGHITGLNNFNPTDVGQTSVFVDGAPGMATSINCTGTGILDIGASDVQALTASSASNLIMDLPGSNVTKGIVVIGSASGQNLLQGTSGTLAPTVISPVVGEAQAYVGDVGNDVITGGTSADNIFGEGGSDIITLSSASSTVWIGFYDVGHTGVSGVGTLFLQAITNIVGGAEIFTNGYGSNTTAVINFTLGASGDILAFSSGDWAQGNGALLSGGTDYGLRANTGGFITAGADATLGVVSSPGATPPAAEITVDNISTYANAAQLLNALKQTGVGNIAFFNSLPAHSIQHELIAYGTGNGINIADAMFFNDTNSALNINTANANTPGNLQIQIHDLVDIVGSTALNSINSHNIFFHA